MDWIPATTKRIDGSAWRARLDASGPADPAAGAELDVGLSAELLQLLSDLHTGRVDPARRGVHWGLTGAPYDPIPAAESARIDGGISEALAEAEPHLTQYRRLKVALARYRALAADTLLTRVPAMRTPVRPGDPLAGALALRRVLTALGDLPAGDSGISDGGVYSDALAGGVRSFQARHAMDSDAVIGPATVAALCAPLSGDVQRLELGLERLRWIPEADARQVLVVNIPAFRLWALDSATSATRPALAMNVVVGNAIRRRRTPVIDATMQSIVFHPYWNVPLSIVRHEIIPALRHDAQYLAENDMELVSSSGSELPVDLDTADYLGRLRAGTIGVRQRPGPRDALGLIKFVIANDESIYLHDTPERELFAFARRDFSHGCIRVQDPVGLAQYVLRDDSSWTRDRIVAEMMTEDLPREFVLPRPVRVLIFYTTAVVWPDGRVAFYPNVYGYDRGLEAALGKHPAVPPTAAGAVPTVSGGRLVKG